MDILTLEKTLNTIKTIATLAFLINGLVSITITYRYITKQSMKLD